MKLPEIMAGNLKRLRTERNMSLRQLSDQAGVSSVILSQIERGEGNPTINTIWKIASGLRVPYTALIDAPEEKMQLVTLREAMGNPQFSADGKCCVYCYYPITPSRNFELFGMELDVCGTYASPGHPERAQEYVLVHEGALTVLFGGKHFALTKGDSLHFASDCQHEYRNDGDVPCHILVLNAYDM